MARTKWIAIRVSDEEYIKAKKDPRKNHEIFMTGLTKENVKDRTELITQVKKIGTNINQIARVINSNPDIKIKDLKKYLININNMIKKL